MPPIRLFYTTKLPEVTSIDFADSVTRFMSKLFAHRTRNTFDSCGWWSMDKITQNLHTL